MAEAMTQRRNRRSGVEDRWLLHGVRETCDVATGAPASARPSPPATARWPWTAEGTSGRRRSLYWLFSTAPRALSSVVGEVQNFMRYVVFFRYAPTRLVAVRTTPLVHISALCAAASDHRGSQALAPLVQTPNGTACYVGVADLPDECPAGTALTVHGCVACPRASRIHF